MSTPYDRVLQVCRRVRQVAWMRAFCWICVAILLSFSLGAVVDFWLRPHTPWIRWSLSLSILFAAAGSIAILLYRLRRIAPAPLAVASLIEYRFPTLRDQLVSAVAFSSPGRRPAPGTSLRLAESFVQQVETRLEGLDLHSIVNANSLWRATLTLLITVLSVGSFAFAMPSFLSTALLRLSSPWEATTWPARDHLQFTTTPTILAEGSSLTLQVTDSLGQPPSQVYLEIQRDQPNGKPRRHERIPMLRDGDTFHFTWEDLRQGFAYRAVGGDDQAMPWTELQVKAAPQIEPTEVVLHYPPYLKKAPQEVTRVVEAVSGSRIYVRGTSSLPLSSLAVYWVADSHQHEADPTTTLADLASLTPIAQGSISSSGLSFQFPTLSAEGVAQSDFAITESGGLYLLPIGNQGVWGTPLRITVRCSSDEKPSLHWDLPTDQQPHTANALVVLRGTAHDDYEVSSIHAEWRPQFTTAESVADSSQGSSEESSPWIDLPLTLSSQADERTAGSVNPQEALFQGQLDLQAMAAAILSRRPNDKATFQSIEMRIIVTDSFGQATTSSSRHFLIITDNQKREALQRQAQRLLQQILKVQSQLQQQEQQLSGLVSARLKDGEWPNITQRLVEDLTLLSAVLNQHDRVRQNAFLNSDSIQQEAQRLLDDAATSRVRFPLATKVLPTILADLSGPFAQQMTDYENNVRQLRRQLSSFQAPGQAISEEGGDMLPDPMMAPTSQAAASQLQTTSAQVRELKAFAQKWHDLLASAASTADIREQLRQIIAKQQALHQQVEALQIKAAIASEETTDAIVEEAAKLASTQRDLARSMNAAEYQLSSGELSPELAAIAKHLQKVGVEAKMRSAADHLKRSRWDAAIRLEREISADLADLFPSESTSPNTSSSAPSPEELAAAQAEWQKRITQWQLAHRKQTDSITALVPHASKPDESHKKSADLLRSQEQKIAEKILADADKLPFPLLQNGLKRATTDMQLAVKELESAGQWPDAAKSALRAQARLDRLLSALASASAPSKATSPSEETTSPNSNPAKKRSSLSKADVQYLRDTQAAISESTGQLLRQIAEKKPLTPPQQSELTRLQQEQAELAQTFQELVAPRAEE
ncbi:MAG: hypothetical protein ACO1RA_19065 [Planctomycetaceae bacterium]